MDISVFSHDLREYFAGRSLKVEFCSANGFVYLHCNQIYSNDLFFCEKYGLFLLFVCQAIGCDFNLEVCLVPKN